MRSGITLAHLSSMLLDDLSADGVKILGPGNRNATSQVEQGAGQWLQDDFAAPAYERNPIAFLEVQRVADRPGYSHLPPASYSAGNHRTYLHSPVIFPIARQLKLYVSKRQMSKHRDQV
jgi:hypothetical protein